MSRLAEVSPHGRPRRRPVRRATLATVLPASLWVASLFVTAFASAVEPTPAPALPDAELPAQLRAVEVVSKNGVVVCASAAASRAGALVLESGGNAIDAAVAAALALGASEPGASGLGGQTYMLICLADGRCVAIDGSARVPLRASRFELQRLAAAGRMYGHKLAATPATLAALAHALSRFGTRTLAEVIAPAIDVADTGVTFTPAHRTYVEGYLDKLRESPYLSNLLLQDGIEVWAPDHRYCFPDLACTLRRIAVDGVAAFYTGEIADAMVADMVASGGWLRHDDLKRVSTGEHEPYRGTYRGFEIISFPLPGSGGAVIEALQILEHVPVEALRSDSAAKHSLVIEATRLALADEARIRIPAADAGRMLLDRARASGRAAMIRPDRALTQEELGDIELPAWLDRDTTQLSVADRFGNVVSITQTLSRIFGAYVATPGLGFPYNGLLEGFDLTNPQSRSYFQPLQPAFTSQAPTIVRRNGKPFLVLGSVGSGRITSAIVLAISNVIDRRLTLREAVEAPRVLWGGGGDRKVYLEIAGKLDDAFADTLQQYGYTDVYRLRFPPRQSDLNAFGAVNAVLISDDGSAVGVGDPRRNGTAVAAGAAAIGTQAPVFPACWRSLWSQGDPPYHDPAP